MSTQRAAAHALAGLRALPQGLDARQWRSRLHDRIALVLTGRILAGELKPGQSLPREVNSLEFFGISRGVYREAIKTLAAKGFVESRPRSGTRVLPPARWHLLDGDVLGWIASNETSRSLQTALNEFHLVLAPNVAALAALRRKQQHFETLRQAVDAMAVHDIHASKARTARLEFHKGMFEAAANPFIGSLYSAAAAAIETSISLAPRGSIKRPDLTLGYQRILDAIARKEAPAARDATSELIGAMQRART